MGSALIDLVEKENRLRDKYKMIRELKNEFILVTSDDLKDTYGQEIMSPRNCLDFMYQYCKDFTYTPVDIVFLSLDNKFNDLVQEKELSLKTINKDLYADEKLGLDAIIREYEWFMESLEPLKWAYYKRFRNH